MGIISKDYTCAFLVEKRDEIRGICDVACWPAFVWFGHRCSAFMFIALLNLVPVNYFLHGESI